MVVVASSNTFGSPTQGYCQQQKEKYGWDDALVVYDKSSQIGQVASQGNFHMTLNADMTISWLDGYPNLTTVESKVADL